MKNVILGPNSSSDLKLWYDTRPGHEPKDKIDLGKDFIRNARVYPADAEEVLLGQQATISVLGGDTLPATSIVEYNLIKENLIIFSHFSTAPLERILGNSMFKIRYQLRLESQIEKNTKRVEQLFATKLGIKAFRSLLTRDDLVLRTILQELAERGACEKDKELAPKIAIISEQDTIYGRLLDDIVEGMISDIQVEDVKCQFNVSEYGYLRGVDGELPFGSRIAESTDRSNESGSNSDSFSLLESLVIAGRKESDVGPRQFDYISRLAMEIQNGANGDSAGNAGKLIAVGVLGSDVYDKLLIMQALKPRLPSAIFFTTDLDTRFYGRDVYDQTKNLLVASSYGLKIQGQDAPAFRDSYQTSFFRSVKQSLGFIADQEKSGIIERVDSVEVRNFSPPTPVLYEIGRSGPIDIRNQANRTHVNTDPNNIHGGYRLVEERDI